MVRVEGFEPTNHRVKICCVTASPYPNSLKVAMARIELASDCTYNTARNAPGSFKFREDEENKRGRTLGRICLISMCKQTHTIGTELQAVSSTVLI